MFDFGKIMKIVDSIEKHAPSIEKYTPCVENEYKELRALLERVVMALEECANAASIYIAKNERE